MGAKMGRPPSEDPKLKRISVRVNKEDLLVLEKCCKHFNVSKSEVFRIGLSLIDELMLKGE